MFLDCRLSSRRFVHNFDFVNAINAHQKSWRATRYEEYENFSLEELTRRAGGLYSRTSRYYSLLVCHQQLYLLLQRICWSLCSLFLFGFWIKIKMFSVSSPLAHFHWVPTFLFIWITILNSEHVLSQAAETNGVTSPLILPCPATFWWTPTCREEGIVLGRQVCDTAAISCLLAIAVSLCMAVFLVLLVHNCN